MISPRAALTRQTVINQDPTPQPRSSAKHDD